MFTDGEISLLQDYYSSASSFLILLSGHPTFDQVSSGLALHLALQGQKKPVEIICPAPMRVEFGSLVGVDQIKNQLGNRSLQVTFPYEESMVENVSYHIDKDNQKFHLVIRPKKGSRSLDPSSIEYAHVGLDADMVFLLGIKDWSDIPEYFAQEEQALVNAHTVSLHPNKTSFAKVNIDASQTSSLSELSLKMFDHLQLPLSSDIATNLFAGIDQTTNGFKHARVNAETFEACAQLLRLGARRPRVMSQNSSNQPGTNSLAEAFAKQLNKDTQPPKTPQTPSQFAPMAR